jgi:peptidoglycan/LPS O-acetylase OafA/YrhL
MKTLSFNNSKMPPIRALLAILIVVGHFSYFGVDELNFLRVLAPVCVSLFLFISGYGLMVSYQKKGDAYLQTFLKKRLLKIVLPAILVSLLHLLLCGNGGISFLDRVRLIFTQGTTLLPHYWFVWAILYEYLIFWCSFKWLPKALPRYAVLLLTIAFAVVTARAGFDRCWWVCSLAFPTGLFFAAHENDIFSFCNKKAINYWLAIALCSLAFAGLYISGRPMCWALCYIFIPSAAALVIARLPLDTIKLPILRWTGAVSYEIYLIHITAMTFLRGKYVYISSNLLFVVAVLCITVGAAYGIHLLSQLITQKTN